MKCSVSTDCPGAVDEIFYHTMILIGYWQGIGLWFKIICR